MGAFQRFARSVAVVREVDFLIVAASLVAALLAYKLLPAVGGLVGRVPALASTSPLSVLGIVLLLSFIGLPLLVGAVAAARPGELRGIALRIAVASTLLVQALVALFAAGLAFAYSSFLLAYPEVATFFDLPHASPWELQLQRVVAVVVLARVALTLVLIPVHGGRAYTPGDTAPRVAVASVLVAVLVVVTARLLGSLASFALVDAWAIAGVVPLLFRGPSHEE